MILGSLEAPNETHVIKAGTDYSRWIACQRFKITITPPKMCMNGFRGHTGRWSRNSQHAHRGQGRTSSHTPSHN